MIFKKTGWLVACLLCTFVICSCDLESNIEYVFDNNSSYTVQITLSQPHSTTKPTKDYEPQKTSSTLTVYTGNAVTVYVDNMNVDFQWTTSYAGDNPKVYCTTRGAKATFNDR